MSRLWLASVPLMLCSGKLPVRKRALPGSSSIAAASLVRDSDEPSQGGGQLPYWYEESLVAFLRESDVPRLQRRGELSDASLA